MPNIRWYRKKAESGESAWQEVSPSDSVITSNRDSSELVFAAKLAHDRTVYQSRALRVDGGEAIAGGQSMLYVTPSTCSGEEVQKRACCDERYNSAMKACQNEHYSSSESASGVNSQCLQGCKTPGEECTGHCMICAGMCDEEFYAKQLEQMHSFRICTRLASVLYVECLDPLLPPMPPTSSSSSTTTTIQPGPTEILPCESNDEFDIDCETMIWTPKPPRCKGDGSPCQVL